jgi:hypothetical protein
MSYDPNQPAYFSPKSSAVMRAQFQGLKELIDAVSTITSAQVVAVNTLPPGDSASVGLSISGSTLQFTFDIPAGQSGPPVEVTHSALDSAISTTAQNPSSVSPISGSFSDPDVNTLKESSTI